MRSNWQFYILRQLLPHQQQFNHEQQTVISVYVNTVLFLTERAAIAQSVWRLVTGWKVRASNPLGGKKFRARLD
jgi:hypothetical protein